MHHASPSIQALLAHRVFVRALARRLVADDARADDVAQDVWMAVADRPPREDRGVVGWLARLTHRRAVDARRSDRRETRKIETAAVAAASRERVERSAADVVADAEVARRVVEAVMSLDEPFRTAIVLRFYESLPPREIAARTGVPVETVRSRVRRGLGRLRDVLGPRGRPSSDAAWRAALVRLALPAAGADGAMNDDCADGDGDGGGDGGGSGDGCWDDSHADRHRRDESEREPAWTPPSPVPLLARRTVGWVPTAVAAGLGLLVVACGLLVAWGVPGVAADEGAGRADGGSVARADAVANRGPVRRRRPVLHPRAARPVEAVVAPAPAPPAPAAAPEPEDSKDLTGEWDVILMRKGWQPETTTGRLVLSKKGAKWSGTLRFDIVLRAATFPLADVVPESSGLRFRLDSKEFDLAFTARRDGDGLSGACKWKDCGDFPWTATRPGAAPAWFEPGTEFERDLPRGDAAKLGIDPAALDDLIRVAARDDTDALVVVKDGKLVAERSFGRPGGEIQLMSVTKAIVALCVAKGIEDGRIASLDVPLSRWLPQFRDEPRSAITLRHVVSHTTGIRHGKDATKLNEAKDKLVHVSGLAVDGTPGTQWSYSNEGAALLSPLMSALSIGTVDGYAKQEIFQPCGVTHFTWDRDEAGRTLTYANLAMPARDLARIGAMLANGGRDFDGRTVLSAASLKLLATPPVAAFPKQGLLWSVEGDPASKAGQTLFHTGWLGQWFIVCPKTRLVAVRLRRWKDDAGAKSIEFEAGGFGRRVAALVK